MPAQHSGVTLPVSDGTDGTRPRLMALDWGTSALRGWLLGDGGAVLTATSGKLGILSVANGAFEAAYRAFTADWRATHPGLPALACGMIGSRQGWAEVPYVACPAGLADLVGRGVTVGEVDASLRIVPGLSCQAPDGMIDVMRGEETQTFGAVDGPAASEQVGDGLFILPGTHSKWAAVEGGRICRFATYMTGELFAVLRGHSILGRMMPTDGSMAHDAEAFLAGARDGLTNGADLSRRLFGVRTRGLFGDLDTATAPSFLSGLLIGAEIRGAYRDGGIGAGARRATLIGEATLCLRYADALRLVGMTPTIADPDVTPRGLWRLAAAAGMIAA